MPAELAVIEKNRTFGAIRGLHSRGHFAGVERIAVGVGIPGDQHCGGISNTLVDLVIRRVLAKSGEIVWIVRGAKFVFPNV